MTNLPPFETVADLIREVCAAEIMPLFNRLESHHLSDKQSGELVTAADLASEARFTEALSRMAPGTVVVGEEAVDHDPAVLDRLAGDVPTWIVDPLDGTRNFAHGLHCFAVIIALADKGETVRGWIYDPLDDVMLMAARGEGAWTEEGQIRIPQDTPVGDMTGSMGKRRRERLHRHCETAEPGTAPAHVTRYGCTGREYMDLALGKLHFAEYAMLKPWDHAAGILIHGEAGGCSRFVEDGTAYRPTGILHERILLAPDNAGWNELDRLLKAI